MTATCEIARDLAAGYVIGALEADEEALVREHLATCPEPHDEFAELGGIVPILLETVELVEPPASLKDRVMAAAAADLAARGVRKAGEDVAPSPGPTLASPSVTPFPSAEQRAERQRRRLSPVQWVAGLAAVLVIAALGAWNVNLVRELDTARDYQRGLSAVLDLAARPGSQTAILTPEGGSGPTGLAAVGTDGRVAIVMRDLAPTTGNEVYETWVIGADDRPVAIGGFKVGPTGTATFIAEQAPVAPGVTVALTREPAPGATAPSGPPISVGKAVAATS